MIRLTVKILWARLQQMWWEAGKKWIIICMIWCIVKASLKLCVLRIGWELYANDIIDDATALKILDANLFGGENDSQM